MMYLLAILLMAVVLPAGAKNENKQKVTYLVSMTCDNCKNRIEKTLSFEKGVTDMNVDLPAKTVTIEYNSDKTSADKLKTAIQKLGYTVTPFRAKKAEAKADSTKAAACCQKDGKAGACCQKEGDKVPACCEQDSLQAR